MFTFTRRVAEVILKCPRWIAMDAPVLLATLQSTLGFTLRTLGALRVTKLTPLGIPSPSRTFCDYGETFFANPRVGVGSVLRVERRRHSTFDYFGGSPHDTGRLL